MNINWLEQTVADLPAENQWLSPGEAICLGGLRFAKRSADWRLGRWTAKHAVALRLGLPTDLPALANIEIRAASSGAPEAFLYGQRAQIAISLSHSSGVALCAVAPAETTFGCDLETIEPRSAPFVNDYFTDDEKALVVYASANDRPLVLALLWSGKESALKALHVGLRLDTRCMCVSPDEWPQEFARDLHPPDNPDDWHPLHVRYSGSRIFEGWWRVQNQLVRTIVFSQTPSLETLPAASIALSSRMSPTQPLLATPLQQ